MHLATKPYIMMTYFNQLLQKDHLINWSHNISTTTVPTTIIISRVAIYNKELSLIVLQLRNFIRPRDNNHQNDKEVTYCERFQL